ncbi:50S ribosomal protein L11 methyltransferase [Mucilaginibacter mali]|uniref:Ribosomal protein L11 methyltransferase n=1 Tax=Mucilaginibacter mali TaxID=2740462 RepID=A0A7D4PVA0_9SPHI|nr:50S ribosomal protein L11 methyltransferase [Mucilaginibacter mali]QKJ30863.1 50S ribosomal protein L11 methyltransferase [Mucilaginibacter mali]
MNYYELYFKLTDAEDYQQDLLIDALGEIGFDTFEEVADGFKAYIPVDVFDDERVGEVLAPYKEMFNFSYDIHLVEQKNWNEVWESNFEPMQIDDQIYVRATFHEPRPEFPYEIVIDPKMAFGTGHHETTTMMMQHMLNVEFEDKNVLDMGCGTGILAILASKLSAETVTAIDYDVICYESTIENSELNGIYNITPLCGSKEIIPDEEFDVILANINRNILLDQIPRYSEVLCNGGEIYFSGFYEAVDLPMITEAAGKHGLTYVSHLKMKDWVAAKFVK